MTRGGSVPGACRPSSCRSSKKNPHPLPSCERTLWPSRSECCAPPLGGWAPSHTRTDMAGQCCPGLCRCASVCKASKTALSIRLTATGCRPRSPTASRIRCTASQSLACPKGETNSRTSCQVTLGLMWRASSVVIGSCPPQVPPRWTSYAASPTAPRSALGHLS
jgi:hypothetical protein